MLRILIESLFVGMHGGRESSLVGECHTAVEPGLHVAGVVADRLVEVEFRLAGLVDHEIGQTAVKVGQHVGAVAAN